MGAVVPTDRRLTQLLGDLELDPGTAAAYANVRAPSGAAIAFRYDDAFALDYSHAFPQHKTSKLPGGLAIANIFLGDTSGAVTGYARMNQAQAQEMLRAGFEYIHHTRNHDVIQGAANMDAKFQDEAFQAATDLTALLQAKPDNFAIPGNWKVNGSLYYFDTPAKIDSWQARQLRSRYAAFEAYLSTDTFHTVGTSPYYRAFPSPARWGASHISGELNTLQNLEYALNFCIQYGGCTEVLTHTGLLDNGGTNPGNLSQADWLTFLEYTATQRDKGLVDVLTPTGLLFARPGQNVNLVRDPGWAAGPAVGGVLSAYAATSPYCWFADAGAPSIQAGPTSGSKCLQVDSGNWANQWLVADTLRVQELTFDARCAVAGQTASVRVIVEAVSEDRATLLNTTVAGGTTRAIDQTLSGITDTWHIGDGVTTNRFRCVFSSRSDCSYLKVRFLGVGGNGVHVANPVLRRL